MLIKFLDGTKREIVDLSNADLSNADLHDADLHGADLIGALNARTEFTSSSPGKRRLSTNISSKEVQS